MELFGKIVSPKRQTLNLNGQPELLINHSSSRINLSAELLKKLDCADSSIGFGYDPSKKLSQSPAFIYVLPEGGCKVGNAGTVSNKFHADRLKQAFPEVGQANRFKLSVDTENPIIYDDKKLYAIDFIEVLPELTRNRSKETNAEANGSEVADAPIQFGTIPGREITSVSNHFEEETEEITNEENAQ